MKLTAIVIPAPEGGFTVFASELPGAISEGETMEEARENLADAARLVLKCNRELADTAMPTYAQREADEVVSFERHLRAHGCVVCEENAKHAIWRNPANGNTCAVAHHREIKTQTVQGICKALDIPKP
jgi:predicted RNase H-like HicB family nuclease